MGCKLAHTYPRILSLYKMPATIGKNLASMTDPEMEVELAKILPDLRQQFAVAGVSNLVMAHIAKATFCSVAKFQVFAFSPEGVMAMCTRLGLDPMESLDNHGLAASMVLVWQPKVAFSPRCGEWQCF